jgi:hypothetical protein
MSDGRPRKNARNRSYQDGKSRPYGSPKNAEKFRDRLADFTGVRGELPVPGDKLPGLDE